ncbi:hypothetical protein DFH07DRAFT_963172 [Mycena maculata]|uniref:Beta-ketoacyl synthase-like N-terminal domain-containing protein n=1 Tax=Mycena maculata TaxID=230809 RepID=A0AAD7N4R5_9AGAR|nr:hypothetical protein DFH07DRAFT_963172 [Mycena maculata]
MVNRINYVYDLLGPSLLVDTACPSALTVMHLALRAIQNDSYARGANTVVVKRYDKSVEHQDHILVMLIGS